MSANPILHVYEHEPLDVGAVRNGVVFTEAHLKAMVRLHAQLSQPFFTLSYRGVRFSHYVGTIWVLGLILEVLPKADAQRPASPLLWRSVLMEMLTACRMIRPHTLSGAAVRHSTHTMLEAYLAQFLAETEVLCRRGLRKQYDPVEENGTTFRGAPQFAQHVRHNFAHKERLFTRYQRRTLEHPLHALLKKALSVIVYLKHPTLSQKAQRLLGYFETVPDTAIVPPHISYDRHTEPYRAAVTMAQHILQHHFPNLYGHHATPGLALMLDMNLLFEEYIYQALRRAPLPPGVKVARQVSRDFWGQTKVRPDLLITLPDDQPPIIVDTKWKILKGKPSSADLQQIFVYSHLFGAQRAILLYPEASAVAERQRFHVPHHSEGEVNFVRIVDYERQGLNLSIGEELIALLDL